MSGANAKERKNNSKAKLLIYSLLGGACSLMGIACLPSFLVHSCSNQNGAFGIATQIDPCLLAFLFVLLNVGCAIILLIKILEAISETHWIYRGGGK
jgi:hypothetical protein